MIFSSWLCLSACHEPFHIRRVGGERTLADTAYAKLKNNIFEFELLPGDRFSETDIAGRLGMSRTPVREALYRLEREGYTQVHFRVGWSVRAFDFAQFENLYDLRLVLEMVSVQRLCERADRPERAPSIFLRVLLNLTAARHDLWSTDR